MAAVTIKLGKRGKLVLPIALRRQLGLEAGALLAVEANGGEIRLRLAGAQNRSLAAAEDRDYAAYCLLNSRTQEEWDAQLCGALKLGVDPAQIEGLPPNHRETLPTQAEWEQQMEMRRSSRLEALHSS